ncbi:hypothetical protein P3T73_12385 [Kiritimatiellota bacterium B12222]|nr:hypothetical protein P3T73_12385 [Kiritimatiellota bacterium B12222]
MVNVIYTNSIRRASNEAETMGEDQVTVIHSEPPNWITEQGVWKKRKDLEPRFPKLGNARFITLTMDPNRYPDPEQAYEIGKRHMRQFLYTLAQELNGGERIRYCWKLEIHKNGFPHWHLILLYRKKIDITVVREAWGKGRIDVQQIQGGQDFSYLFKYATKCQNDLPIWILERKQIRFFQSSPGFLLPDPNAKPKSENQDAEPQAPTRKRRESTLGERLNRWGRTYKFRTEHQMVVFVAHDRSFYADLLLASAQHFVSVPDSSVRVHPIKIEMDGHVLSKLIKRLYKRYRLAGVF